ncbi:sugar transferase [Microbacteriaceae bacterium VKM Ac-2855]|nr:sugar transferase [Microbacteriaceae bacterium VKM Ac-2855]
MRTSNAQQWRRRFRTRAIIGDAVVIVVSMTLTFWFSTIGRAPLSLLETLAPVGVGVVWMVLLLIAHSRSSRHLGTGLDEYRRTVTATGIAFGGVAIASLLLLAPIHRDYFAIGLPVGIVGLVLSHWLNRTRLAKDRIKGHALLRVIVIGDVNDVSYVLGQIERRRASGQVEYDVIGVALSNTTGMTEVVSRGRTVPVVGRLTDIRDAVERLSAEAVIVAGPIDGGSEFVRRLGWQLEESSVELVVSPGLTNVAGPRIHWRPVEGLPLMSVELPHYSGSRHYAKRCLDVFGSAMALLLLSPVFLALAILVKRDSDGPALFKQQRIGRYGRPFTMVKFRSMAVDAEARLAAIEHLNEGSGPLFKLREDPRITRIGRVLRRYSLDELPQFWNVLRGDMSLVGPRPPLLREVESYDSEVNRRLYIKPGITGMWQTNGRSELNWEDSVRLDLYYVENWSVTGDLVILWRTVMMMVKPTGAY